MPTLEPALCAQANLHPLGWRAQTDQARCFRYALALAPETEFFIRKAVGWA